MTYGLGSSVHRTKIRKCSVDIVTKPRYSTVTKIVNKYKKKVMLKTDKVLQSTFLN